MNISVNFSKMEDLETFLYHYNFEESTFCGVNMSIDSLTIEWEELEFCYEDGIVSIGIDELFNFKNEDKESIQKACVDLFKYLGIE